MNKRKEKSHKTDIWATDRSEKGYYIVNDCNVYVLTDLLPVNWTKFEICLAQCCQITQVKPEKTDAAALDSKAFRTEVVSS